jgi:sugar phosphate isomerase/epimerase
MHPSHARIDVALSLSGLQTPPGTPAEFLRQAITFALTTRCQALHLDATHPGLRPRELDRSARRDVAAHLRREGLAFSGLDLWIPPAHLADNARADRAAGAITAAITLAADLAKLCPNQAHTLPPTVCIEFPALGTPPGLLDALCTSAATQGVQLADFGPAAQSRVDTPNTPTPGLGVGVDPAAELLAGRDPIATIAKLGQCCVAARLTDATGLGRVPVGTGRLDLPAFRATLSISTPVRCIVLDLRTLADQATAAATAINAWQQA